MGFSTWNFGPTGEFLANQAVAIFSGSQPRSLSMVDRVEPTIAVNLETAARIGFHFPFDVLVVADEIFEKTLRPVPQDKSVVPQGVKFTVLSVAPTLAEAIMRIHHDKSMSQLFAPGYMA